MRFLRSAFLVAAVLIWSLACGRQIADRKGDDDGSIDRESTETPALGQSEEAEEQVTSPLVVFLGDSLTAGMGVAENEAFPAVLATLLAEEGQSIRIINAGISGDTTAGGLNRTPWMLSQSPDLVVVELGANDGLRGLDPAATEENLRQILRQVKAAGARALLIGIYVPPNYGPDYSERFASLFPRLAKEEEVAFLPFLLEGVAGIPELNQADGIHPNREGHRRVAQHVFEPLSELLRKEPIDG